LKTFPKRNANLGCNGFPLRLIAIISDAHFSFRCKCRSFWRRTSLLASLLVSSSSGFFGTCSIELRGSFHSSRMRWASRFSDTNQLIASCDSARTESPPTICMAKRARARIDSFNLLRRNLSLQRHRISSIPLSRNLLFIDIVIFLLKKCRFRKRKESTLQPKRARSCQAERASRADPCIALPPRSPIAISPSISRDVGIATLQHFREHEHAPMTKTCHGRSNYVCMDAQWHNLRCTARLGSITNIRQPILSNDQRICGRSPCARDIMSTTTD